MEGGEVEVDTKRGAEVEAAPPTKALSRTGSESEGQPGNKEVDEQARGGIEAAPPTKSGMDEGGGRDAGRKRPDLAASSSASAEGRRTQLGL